MSWGLLYPELPDETCVIASYAKEDAALPAHPFAQQELASAPRNPGILEVVNGTLDLHQDAATAEHLPTGDTPR